VLHRDGVNTQQQALSFPPECCIGSLPEALLRIREPRRRIAIWERRVPTDVVTWLARELRMPHDDRRCALPPEGNAGPALDAILNPLAPPEGADLRSSAAFRRWRRDLLDLIDLARRIAPQTPKLMLRLQRMEGRDCPRFHVDRVPLRMICAYVGAGTEWLPEVALDRSRLATGDSAEVRDGSAVQRISTGHVAVMKGDSFPGNSGRGLVHRSPEASPTQPRVLVAIDFG
jgi:Protein of unknown function (DUF1826)